MYNKILPTRERDPGRPDAELLASVKVLDFDKAFGSASLSSLVTDCSDALPQLLGLPMAEKTAAVPLRQDQGRSRWLQQRFLANHNGSEDWL